jgi:hypothetical protein
MIITHVYMWWLLANSIDAFFVPSFSVWLALEPELPDCPTCGRAQWVFGANISLWAKIVLTPKTLLIMPNLNYFTKLYAFLKFRKKWLNLVTLILRDWCHNCHRSLTAVPAFCLNLLNLKIIMLHLSCRGSISHPMSYIFWRQTMTDHAGLDFGLSLQTRPRVRKPGQARQARALFRRCRFDLPGWHFVGATFPTWLATPLRSRPAAGQKRSRSVLSTPRSPALESPWPLDGHDPAKEPLFWPTTAVTQNKAWVNLTKLKVGPLVSWQPIILSKIIG